MNLKRSRPAVLALDDSDDDDRTNVDIDIGDDDLSNDLRALDKLRQSVQKNLRLRPIPSSQRLSSTPWNPHDSETETDNTVEDEEEEEDDDSLVSEDEPPMSAVSAYFTPLTESPPPPIAQGISALDLQRLLLSSNAPLLIDTRPPNVHSAAHIVGSVNVAIPSLLLKRTRKQKPPTATFPTLQSFRQYITTDLSLDVWDRRLPTLDPLALIVVYDQHMDPSQRDNPASPSWGLVAVLQGLLPARVRYLHQGFNGLPPDFHKSFVIQSNSHSGSAFVRDGGKLVPSPLPTTTTLKKPPSHGLFQLDTLAAFKSKPLPEIDLGSSTASPGEHPHVLPSSSPRLSPASTGGWASNVSSPSPTRLHHLHVPSASNPASATSAFLTAHTTLTDPPRSPMPMMPTAIIANSPLSPFTNFNSHTTNGSGSTPSSSASSSSTRASNSPMSTKLGISIPDSLILDSSPSPPPSRANPHLAFRKPLPASGRRTSIMGLRKVATDSPSPSPPAPAPKPKLGLDIKSTEGLPRLDNVKSAAAAISSLPRLDIKSATRTKSAERLPKLSLKTTGIGGHAINTKGRSATLSVPPSAIGDGGGFANNLGGGGGSGIHIIPSLGGGGNGGADVTWGSSTGGSGYGGHANQAMRSPVDWSFLNAGFGKMAQSVGVSSVSNVNTTINVPGDTGNINTGNGNGNGEGGEGESGGESRRGRTTSRERDGPFYTPPHSPGTPKAPAPPSPIYPQSHSHRNTNLNLPHTRNHDPSGSTSHPSSPRTARPDGSSPSSGGFPSLLPLPVPPSHSHPHTLSTSHPHPHTLSASHSTSLALPLPRVGVSSYDEHSHKNTDNNTNNNEYEHGYGYGYGYDDNEYGYPASPAVQTDFPKSPMASSFGFNSSSSSSSMDPPLSAFGSSFPHTSSSTSSYPHHTSSFPHHTSLDYDSSPSHDFDDSSPPTTEDPHPPFSISTILPSFLFLGPEPSLPSHVTMLRECGVKRILNLAAECHPDDHGLQLGEAFERYVKIAMRDHVEEEGVGGKVREVCDILDDARLHSAPTYVHCKAGKSRSVTAIIAYLIHANHWTLSKAYAFVLERRKGISPNIGFVSELMTFEEEELGGKSVGVQPTGGGVNGDGGGGGGVGHHHHHGMGMGMGGGRRGGHVRESLPPVFTTGGPVSALEPMVGGLCEGSEGGEGGEGGAPMSAGAMAVGHVRAEVGQDMEIKDAQGRWRHARRAPVDEQTLQPMRRVSKAGLESSAYGGA